MIEIVVCRTGMARHAPLLEERVRAAGGVLGTVECFDRCETCERVLIARIDGATARFRDEAELLTALAALQGGE